MQDDDLTEILPDDPALDVIEQAEVSFFDDDILLAAMGSDGEVYVPIVPFCEHLGLGSPKHQVRTIRADEDMREAMRLMPIGTTGGIQQLQCLRVDMLTLWLGHIRRNMIKESARAALSRYKREAARAILNHFMAKAATKRAMATTTPPTPAIVMPTTGASPTEWRAWHMAMAEMYGIIEVHDAQIAEHDQRLNQHDLEIAGLSDDMSAVKESLAVMGELPEPRITIHQANQIQALVSKIHDATQIHQATIFAAFKKQWKLPRYDELPATQFERAMDWLRQWGRAQLPKKP